LGTDAFYRRCALQLCELALARYSNCPADYLSISRMPAQYAPANRTEFKRLCLGAAYER
jgi:hypothetical protein